MKILIIGSHGKVGLRLVKALSSRGYHTRAMIRNMIQAQELENLGAEPYFADLESDFSGAFKNMDIVVFTAGSGGHTGPDKTIDIDQNAAIRSMDIALVSNIKRYIMVSAQGVREPDSPSKIQHYYKAKRKADDYLISSGIDHTIFRPGRLIDTEGTGLIEAAEYIKRRGETSRENLANAIAESISIESTNNKLIEILEGDNPIREALLSV